MKILEGRQVIISGVSGLLLAVISLNAGAQTGNGNTAGAAASTGAASGQTREGRAQVKGEEKQDASIHIAKATQAVKKMEQDPQVRKLMKQSRGIFIIPDYGRAALGVGAQGGAGVLVAHQGGNWASPGFYNFGGVSIGAQAGVSAGQIAMLLMSDKALNAFGSNNKFALDADAGLTIVAWSKRITGSAGRGDIVMWSDARGAFADLNVGVTDVNFDESETKAFYGKPVSAQDIVSGKASTTKGSKLVQTLSGK